MIIDSHCHLDYEPLYSNISNVLKRAEVAGVKYFLTICTTDSSFEKILLFIDKFNNIFGTYGIHPHETKNHTDLNIDKIKNNVLKNKKIIGIGETGLDFYYNHSEKKFQKSCFLKHIHACQETSKTLIVHSRSAEDETFDIISSEMKNKNFKVLMHCFTGSKQFAHKLLDLGCFFSASGIITFKNSSTLAQTFLSIPIDKILVETDSPYLSPEPLRGKQNEPSNIVHTLKFLANLKKVKYEDLSSITTQNFFQLFGKLN